MRILFRTLITILMGAYCLAASLLYVYQDQFLYYPTSEPKLVNATAFSVQQETKVLRGWVINPGKKQALMYFGGNAEQIDRNIETFKTVFSDYSVYLLNYRGYGSSDGQPSEKALLADALKFYDQIAEQYDSMSVIGKSLGSGVASYLAASRKVEKLVLVTPYDSIEDVAQQRFWMMPVNLILRDKYKSVEWVKNLSTRTLVVMSEFDATIPRQHSLNLIAAFANILPEQYVVKGAQHNTISNFREYYARIKQFL